MRAAVVLLLLMCVGCTLDVGQPKISIDCVEVDFPGEHVLYCDGGYVPMPTPKDAGGE